MNPGAEIIKHSWVPGFLINCFSAPWQPNEYARFGFRISNFGFRAKAPFSLLHAYRCLELNGTSSSGQAAPWLVVVIRNGPAGTREILLNSSAWDHGSVVSVGLDRPPLEHPSDESLGYFLSPSGLGEEGAHRIQRNPFFLLPSSFFLLLYQLHPPAGSVLI